MALAQSLRLSGLACLRTSAGQQMARGQMAGGQMVASRMASNRNHPIEGGSNETNITEEVRDLIKNMRTAENIDEWQVGIHFAHLFRLIFWHKSRTSGQNFVR